MRNNLKGMTPAERLEYKRESSRKYYYEHREACQIKRRQYYYEHREQMIANATRRNQQLHLDVHQESKAPLACNKYGLCQGPYFRKVAAELQTQKQKPSYLAEIKRLEADGWSLEEIAVLLCLSKRTLVSIIKKGESK